LKKKIKKKYSFTFWAGGAALEVYMSKLEVLTFSIVVFLFNKIFEKVKKRKKKKKE
jgi:hypothetical protein